ncbi:MAG: M3 family oligoendopeptidase [Bacteroidetes bacterium]|nr:M3 family oligoendopeptidase [Bacteroidota bacterium]
MASSNSLSKRSISDPKTGAEFILWDLSDLFTSEKALLDALESCISEATRFSSSFRGKVDLIQNAQFAVVMSELGSVQDTIGRAYTYAYLNWSTDTSDPKRGALLQKVKEAYTEVSTKLLFFDLEWTLLDEEKVESILQLPEMKPFSHYLEVLALGKQHLLSEPEERVMVEKHNTGRSAWNRFFDETLGDLMFDVSGEKLTQQQILARLHDGDRAIRKEAADAFTHGLKGAVRPLTFVFNTILADKALDDRLRKYPSWISSRNQSNEVADADVEALISAVQEGYKHVSRFYSIKKQLLKLDEMFEYDRYAPIGEADRQISWEEAKEMVLAAYYQFHPQMGEIAQKFFDENWIDAALAPAKRGGAFSHGAVPSAHPYIMVNYTGKIRDVQTLAHELGHGIHQYLSRKQGIFHADTPLTTAETASVFGEMLVFQRLMKAETNDENRLAMLMGKIDDTIATVFRQVSMNRFEEQIHTMRREKGELSAEEFSEAWVQTQTPMFGGSVTLTENYRWWWSYIPHFLHTPGYVYAYAFGELLVLALYAKYEAMGDAFAESYLELLSAGGSDWPHVLVGKLGVDLKDPKFWAGGVAAIGQLVDEAEALSQKIALK